MNFCWFEHLTFLLAININLNVRICERKKNYLVLVVSHQQCFPHKPIYIQIEIQIVLFHWNNNNPLLFHQHYQNNLFFFISIIKLTSSSALITSSFSSTLITSSFSISIDNLFCFISNIKINSSFSLALLNQTLLLHWHW